MLVEGNSKLVLTNNILSGSYSQNVNRGIRAKLFEFSSPTYAISNFKIPYDAQLTQNGQTIAAAQKVTPESISSNRSGKLYFYDQAELFGTCHGFGRNTDTFYNGNNFYNAFYPGGYFAPPFGENISLYQINQNEFDNLSNGGCPNLSVTEYNEQNGIVSMQSSDSALMVTNASPNSLSPILCKKQACPSDLTIENYYDEAQFRQIQGTSVSLGAGTFYNNNPIPTSLDAYRINLNSRYIITGSNEYFIRFEGGRPMASYTASSQISDFNNSLCFAGLLETSVSVGKGTNSSNLMQFPDVNQGASQDQVFTNEGLDVHFNYWNFLYKENADMFPFYNSAVSINTDKTISNKTLSQDTLLFKPVLSSEDYYWQNRQCSDIVDFLPWTFGASIYACPSLHFDIPYYAAIKKFGFYGTRFLNTCNKTDLSNSWSGVDDVSELPESQSDYLIDKGESEPEGVDTNGGWTFSMYDNILKTASAEERYSNMYALNKGFFLWANAPQIISEENYKSLSKIDGFSGLFSSLTGKFQQIYSDGLSSFISGDASISLSSNSIPFEDKNISDLLFTNEAYNDFSASLKGIVPSDQLPLWNSLESKYSYYISDGNGINESFYKTIISGREKRTLTRYMENSVRGNPIDLFPLNHIYFSQDKGNDFYENTGWGRRITTPSKTEIASVNRSYFEGAYGNDNEVSGLNQSINSLSFVDNSSFFPGFFNDVQFNKTTPDSYYVPVISGVILDEKGRGLSAEGWKALGYNGIGRLDKDFSCFTPIFVQQPLDKVFTKIGQPPTFRALAVDYHTIPDDKISKRYPEIMYWAQKLNLVDKGYKNLYPMKYKWLRIPKTQYTNFMNNGNFGLAEYSNPTGSWACLEGDCPTCTVIHPTESYPTGILKRDDYTFLKGAKKGYDDNYYYMCLASGRFGIRISEKSEIEIEDWLRFDVSLKIGANISKGIPVTMAFEVNTVDDKTYTVEIESDKQPAYCGYQRDIYAIPEAVIEQKIPPPNAGFGDVTAYRFVGPTLYVGSTRSYQPSTLLDTRGLRESWGKFIEYGNLTSFSKNLTQFEGDLLYGYKHLPTCENYSMSPGKKGIKVTAKLGEYYISHWTLSQQAVATTDTSTGMDVNKLDNVGALYPPITKPSPYSDINGNIVWSVPGNDPINGGYGIGHWQWGNNLGSIKRFGFTSTPESDDLAFIGKGSPQADKIDASMLRKAKKMLSPTTLAGENCGYNPLGLGRNMIYYIETYDRFYILCDPLKKKNVKNLSYMAPGIRSSNSAIQYFWMGHPSNTYVERRPMYGPYAFQWRVKRHNRDRNGNGISEGFYSMGKEQRFSLMYDAPAVFGLYSKVEPSSKYKGQVQTVLNARNKIFKNGIGNIGDFKTFWFGEQGEEGTSLWYGNYFYSCSSQGSTDKNLCDYVSKAQSLATNLDFAAYDCPPEVLSQGKCFDPCLSLRYSHGFIPGGKKLDLFGYKSDRNDTSAKNIRLISVANLKNGGIIYDDEKSILDNSVYFRAPVNTPHARITRGLMLIDNTIRKTQEVQGFSPCKDSGSEHCNYITPTIHLKTSSTLSTKATAFAVMNSFAASLIENYNIRSES